MIKKYDNMPYQTAMHNWLSENYKVVAKNIYSRHIEVEKTKYKSKTLNVILDNEENFKGDEEDKILANIRIKLHSKNKYGTKYNVQELEDFCNITNSTPDQILGVKKFNLQYVLDEADIDLIKKHFDQITHPGETIQLVCLSFPILGVSCIVNIKKNTNWSLVNRLNKKMVNDFEISYKFSSVLVEYKLSPTEQMCLSESYQQMEIYFWNVVKEIASKIGLDKYKRIKPFSSAITTFDDYQPISNGETSIDFKNRQSDRDL